jgi:hypothetical protein
MKRHTAVVIFRIRKLNPLQLFPADMDVFMHKTAVLPMYVSMSILELSHSYGVTRKKGMI